MSRVVFKMSNGHEGTVFLNDNEYVDLWKDIFLKNSTLKIATYQLPYSKFSSTTESEEVCIKYINASIDKLSEYIVFNNRAYKGMSRDICNKIHREFTTALTTRCVTHIPFEYEDRLELIKNGYDFISHNDTLSFFHDYSDKKKFPLKDISAHLESINAWIHHYEDTYLKPSDTPRSIAYKNENGLGFEWQSKKDDGITDSVKTDFYVGDIYKKYCSSSPEYNVYDLKNIRGKDYYKAWIDYDDPGEWDVVNSNHRTKGGFEIAPWTSELFNKNLKPWVRSYNLPCDDEYIAPPALGKVDKQTLVELKTQQLKITDIDLLQ